MKVILGWLAKTAFQLDFFSIFVSEHSLSKAQHLVWVRIVGVALF